MKEKAQNMGLLASAFLAAVIGPFAIADVAQAELKDYRFDISEKTVNFTGKSITALSVGGTIPGPVIEATVGDTLRTTFCNKLDVESSIHWHGVLLPNDQDGVSYLNTKPIAAHKCHTFEFPVKHHGTYWYHSHTDLQEQRGVYGTIIFHPKDSEREYADHDRTLMLSDWTDEMPMDVMRNLKRDGDFYALKKDAVQSWDNVIAAGWPAIKNRLKNSWNRMGPMDISDVGYDAFLANGQKTARMSGIGHGDKVRLRVVNGAASTYFSLQFAGGPMTIVAVDGNDVEPVQVNTQRIGMAETYDIIVSMPHDGRAYEFRATSTDGTGYSSTILGDGKNIVMAPDMPKPNLLLRDHTAHGAHNHNAAATPDEKQNHSMHDMGDMNHAAMDHSKTGGMPETQGPVRNMQEYELLRAVAPTAYDAARPRQEVQLNLTGDMRSYTWSFNNKMLSQSDKITVKKGEVARFVLSNKTMMNHPLHLHGHFFRVLNGQGEYSPIKHTVNVPPHETVIIEFAADEEKDWLFHCHNLYHMMTGMTRILDYEGTPDNPQIGKMHHDRHVFTFGDIGLQQNKTAITGNIISGVDALLFSYDGNYKGNYDIDLHYEHTFSPYLKGFVGGDFDREPDFNRDRQRAVAGFHFLLPMMIDSEWRVDHKGHFRLELSGTTDLTSRLSFNWRANTDKEYRLRFQYELDKKHSWAITAGYDSDFGLGAGLNFRF